MTATAKPDTLAPDARVLVVHVARIGDTLLITPALRALKHACPLGRVGVLAHPGRRELLQGLPFVDTLEAITPRTAWYRDRFSGRRWDAAIVYGQDAPLLRYAARVAARVVAFEQQDAAANRLLWKAVPVPNGIHAVAERLLLPGAFGIETEDHFLEYRVSARELAGARNWLAQRTAGARPLIGFQVASFATKRYRDWPLEHFIELGRRLFARYPRARILVFGDRDSRAAARALRRELGPHVIPLAGDLQLRDTAALMSQLNLYVGVDTGPTHLAGALRIPMVALYHCRHRGRLLAPPQHERLRVIEHPASDADCSNERSMAEIGIDAAWAAVQALLNDRTQDLSPRP